MLSAGLCIAPASERLAEAILAGRFSAGQVKTQNINCLSTLSDYSSAMTELVTFSEALVSLVVQLWSLFTAVLSIPKWLIAQLAHIKKTLCGNFR